MNPDLVDSDSVRSGEFVSEYIEPSSDSDTLPEEAVQPNGVDLSIGTLFKLAGSSRLTNKEYRKPERTPVETGHNDMYRVQPNHSYIVVYDEIITIPENHIGLVFPRSRLMRSGLDVKTAVWDSGYSGVGEGGLSVEKPAQLEQDLRLAQIIFLQTETLEGHYDGSHQGERL